MKRFSKVNGKATNLSKPFTLGSLNFIVEKAETMSANSIAAILHRPVMQVRTAARQMGLKLN